MPLITDLITGSYVRNEGGEAIIGVKPRRHIVGYDYDTRPETLNWMHRQTSLRYPSLSLPDNTSLSPTRLITGLYDVAPDGLPIAGPDPQIDGLYVAAGFNGHGVMHSPAITCALAELITSGKSATLDLTPLNVARFSRESAAPSLAPTLHLL